MAGQIKTDVFEIKDIRTKDIRIYCFVCTGNTCRSPMAEALLNHVGAAHGFFACSRGIAAQSGAPISENACLALEAAGIASEGRNDYRRHRAVQFAVEDFERCDGVFAMSPSHAQALISAFPEYASRVRVLGDIADPYGGDLARYTACFADIERAMRETFPALFAESDGEGGEDA